MRRRPHVLPSGGALAFPDPRNADDEGLVAIGGDLSVDRLLLAYESGIFPWYDAGLPTLWWSPNPRTVLDARSLHVSRSMRRALKRDDYELRFDTAFRAVMVECAKRPGQGTWILPEMIEAYVELHARGHAHSVEVWSDDALIGGLYGVHRGGLFAAESMFHRRTNASKIALVAAVKCLFDAGIDLFDVQFLTPHLASLGAYQIAREQYLERVEQSRRRRVNLNQLTLTV